MTQEKAITVYGASSSHIDPSYFEAARQVGAAIARRGFAVVNGGGSMGLMGASIDGALAEGGRAIGILPEFMMARGWGHPKLTRTEVVADMHERKKRMAELATGVIALPGGMGTYEELFEIMTARQLGLFTGNIVLLNTNGYYDPLLALLRHTYEQHFMNEDHFRQIITVTADPEEAVRIAATPAQPHTYSLKF